VNDNNGQPTGLAEPGTGNLHVLSDDAAVSRRIVATLGEPGMPGVQAISSPGAIDPDFVEESTIFILACDVDEAAGMAGLRRLRRRHREPRIIVISPAATAASVRRALDAGADAFVLEGEIETALAAAARAVATGQSVVPRRVRESVERPAFSHRERQVLALVTEGLTNSEIAERLLLSQSTVKSHLSTAFAKLGIRSRKEVTSFLLDPEQAQSVGLVGVASAETLAATVGGNGLLGDPSTPHSIA
jgi:DNA-binding NarL/FixJ family response regulator